MSSLTQSTGWEQREVDDAGGNSLFDVCGFSPYYVVIVTGTAIARTCFENAGLHGVDFEEIFEDFDSESLKKTSPDSSSFTMPSSQTEIKPKVQRKKPNLMPRIIMNDVRRHYGAMIARVFNSADNDVGNHFVRTFSSSFSPVLTHGYHSDFLLGISSYALCPTMQAIVYGSTATFAEWMQALMFLTQAIFPDLVCRVRNEQIVRRPRERRCTIVID